MKHNSFPVTPPPKFHHLAVRLIVFSGLFILLGTQAPYDFSLVHYSWQEAVREFFKHPSNLVDIVSNIVMFLPFGAGLTIQGRRWGWSYLAAVLFAAGISMGFSVLIETLQLFLPIRTSSAIDIFTNSTGGLLGGLAYWSWCLFSHKFSSYCS